MKLLLVEDEKRLSAVLEKGLKKLCYAVDTAYDGEEALALWEINCYDLIILDLNLPRLDGLGVLRRLRESDRETKVLILSAKNAVEDKIEGLDGGANDFLEKPFDFMELAARIRNLLRWSFVSRDSQLQFGALMVDSRARRATLAGQALELTPKEYAILEYLALRSGCYIAAEELIEHVWDSEADLFSNSLKFHIHSLKKKLGLPGLITNARGKGYCLHVEEHESST